MAGFKNWPIASTRPVVAPNGKPWNFLVLFGDDWPLDIFNEMPTFNATYAADFIDFPNAVSELPLCFPARAAFQTGQSARYNTVTSNDDGATYVSSGAINKTLPVALQNAGYYTGWVGKIYNGLGESGSGGFGTLPWRHPGVIYMAGQWDAPDYFNWTELKSDGTTTAHGTTDTNTTGTDYAVDVERLRALTFLSQVPTNRPWFLCWPSKGCHQGNHGGGEPEPPARYANTSVTLNEERSFGVDGTALGIPDWLTQERSATWTASDISAIRNSHKLALQVGRALDEALCAVLAQVEARGETQNTIVVLCTDNAIAMGELRLNGKGTPHKSGMDMILKIKVPGVAATTCYAPVCVYDLAPTIMKLAGAVPLYPPYGMSMHPLFQDPTRQWREAALIFNPAKKPKFYGLKFGGYNGGNLGPVQYRILNGDNGYTATHGGWTDAAQTVNVVLPEAKPILQRLEDSVS